MELQTGAAKLQKYGFIDTDCFDAGALFTEHDLMHAKDCIRVEYWRKIVHLLYLYLGFSFLAYLRLAYQVRRERSCRERSSARPSASRRLSRRPAFHPHFASAVPPADPPL